MVGESDRVVRAVDEGRDAARHEAATGAPASARLAPMRKPLPASPKRPPSVVRHRGSSMTTQYSSGNGSDSSKEQTSGIMPLSKDAGREPGKFNSLFRIKTRISSQSLRDKLSSPVSPTAPRSSISGLAAGTGVGTGGSGQLFELATATRTPSYDQGLISGFKGGGSSGRNDNKPVVLSSSHSNSRHNTTDGPNIYNFGPLGQASPGLAYLNKSSTALDLKQFPTKESERHSIEDDIWPFIVSHVLKLFSGEGLRIAIEDLNQSVSTYLYCLAGDNRIADVYYYVDELLDIGVSSFRSSLTSTSDERVLPRFAEIWTFFYASVVPYIEAVFLPISIEIFDKTDLVAAHANDLRTKMAPLNDIREFSLRKFRDVVLLAFEPKLRDQLSEGNRDLASTDVHKKLLQALSILASVESDDEADQHYRLHHIALKITALMAFSFSPQNRTSIGYHLIILDASKFVLLVNKQPAKLQELIMEEQQATMEPEGARMKKLRQVLEKSVSATVKGVPEAKFASCFPELNEANPSVLSRIYPQIIDYWQGACRKTFNTILDERDMTRKLNEFDEIVATAKSDPHGGGRAPSAMSPEEVVRAHLYPLKKQKTEELRAALKQQEEENAVLLAALRSQAKANEGAQLSTRKLLEDLEQAAQSISSVDTTKMHAQMEQIATEISR